MSLGVVLGAPPSTTRAPGTIVCSRSFRSKTLASSGRSFGDWEDGPRGIIWDCQQIAQAVGGILAKQGSPGSICTDTRGIHRGDWFLALVGRNFDGNSFLAQALAAGCAGAIGRSMPRDWPVGFVEVSDSLAALHKLAVDARNRYRGHVVGITGSCGKTTTKAMVALALESLGHIHQTQGSENNHIGVPLTLLALPSFSPACVIEMGMNHLGEILELSRICKPSVRVVLNVGPAHMENLGSLEQVALAKGELFRDSGRGDVCILNADDPLVMAMPVSPDAMIRFFGRSEVSDLRLLNGEVTSGGQGVKFTLQQQGVPGSETTFLSCPGIHLASNACAAACVATSLGVPLKAASESISKFSPVGMRSRLEAICSDIQLINDAYNANPMSMTVALEILASVECKGRKVVALGDMLELGDFTRGAHMKAIKCCQELHVDVIGTAGPAFSDALNGLELEKCEVVKCENSAALAEELTARITPGDVVLVKGSRGMRMELVVDAIKRKFLQQVCCSAAKDLK
ncbi:hypothetical protein SELMODRAFT_185918 [Selaginella moellendorffii]|uniref:UDP-MurNAc-pentapeptide synthetase n=1 Tax=Selaginella moellendorffii TaxID=88036 RepID=D8T6M5_SELML|nr:uncharacterized protein LOC9635474 [Selaginella moellendorffii]EFJ07695.1 hypothetical protein SELMODRAFT_185918 [Selaginella moellendorffii]|eukprot:XP_002991267.1 uncharacterized protein LOC9635474 [Selaginella moellendorffii]